MERTYFPPGEEPEVLTMDICERLMGGDHAQCPGWLKYDPKTMEGETVSPSDTVFCDRPCHQKAQG